MTRSDNIARISSLKVGGKNGALSVLPDLRLQEGRRLPRLRRGKGLSVLQSEIPRVPVPASLFGLLIPLVIVLPFLFYFQGMGLPSGWRSSSPWGWPSSASSGSSSARPGTAERLRRAKRARHPPGKRSIKTKPRREDARRGFCSSMPDRSYSVPFDPDSSSSNGFRPARPAPGRALPLPPGSARKVETYGSGTRRRRSSWGCTSSR